MPIGRVPIEQAARQATGACQAHAVIITGSTFAESMEMIQAIKGSAPVMTVILGGGSNPANVGEALRLADGSALSIPGRAGLKSGSAILALRPEAISLHRQNGSASGKFSGIVTHRIFLGSSAEYSIAVEGLGDFLVTADRSDLADGELVEPNERVVLNFDPSAAHIFPA